MLVAAALCPCPPLLVPELASSAADELDDLRAACDEVVSRLVRTGPTMILLLGEGPLTRAHPDKARGCLNGFGYHFDDASGLNGDPEIPLPVTIGRWLLDRAGWGGSVLAHSITHQLPPEACADLGWRLSTGPRRVAILAMGDGSACRGEKAPGYFDPAAEGFDRTVSNALKDADLDALSAIDAEESERLIASYRTPLQALAGAAAGGRWDGEVLYDRAPYGVGYVTAYWSRAGAQASETEIIQNKPAEAGGSNPLGANEETTWGLS